MTPPPPTAPGPGSTRGTLGDTADLTVLADDLTGACEVAGALLRRGLASTVLLAGGPWCSAGAGRPGVGARIVDLDHRDLGPGAAAVAVRSALSALTGRTGPVGEGSGGGSAPLLVKIDSLWRGSIPATVETLRDNGFDVVVAGALPALGRTVVGGVPRLAGEPLARTAAWALEPLPPPESVLDLLSGGGAPVEGVGLDRVRAGGLPEDLAEVLARGSVAVPDAVTDEDLRAVVRAARPTPGRHLALVGTAALVAAYLDEGPLPALPAPRSAVGTDRPRAPLVVVGTGAPTAAAQITHLLRVRPDLHHRALRAAGDAGDPSAADPTGLVLSLAGTFADPAAAAARMTAVAVGAAIDRDLVLVGGRTARAVLTGMGITVLVPEREVAHGAVVSRAPDGRRVATKPGSFGGPTVLADLVAVLTGPPAPPARPEPVAPDTPTTLPGAPMTTTTPTTDRTDRPGPDHRPVVAVTMGDGAGVGPEVTVGALLDEAAHRDARPLVVGDAERLRRGARALGVEVEVVEVGSVDEAEFRPGRIDVVDPHLLPADLPWGEISPVAGHAAHEYVRIACELAMAGAVQAICTAPLNKAALHAAGHLYPGHTELLAHFTGVGEVSMMLTTPRIKVIHVTTHIGLIDAVARIEPGLVERTIRRGHEALVRAGNPSPRIGVCAINPHAGENGLFGYGEEAEKVTPGIEAARAAGIDAVGPLPADTAFFLGGRGDYDLIVAMYHDQGHGPVKVLGIEAGVNITVGLPVIRTSVDHGTAFDIAGTGRVEVGSMVEALRQATDLASAPVPAR
ncbi:4-hydroxythreonine-4-phosphate dehydrogenase PdxA [Kineococcus gynurae]|uniref:4-hydroxythreonine-4-phosphate dehydrogenase PdxA n=1 Tax=Kineococcus gynurae TaxID=452979 RepID=A0ABV5LP21_9ACTN